MKKILLSLLMLTLLMPLLAGIFCTPAAAAETVTVSGNDLAAAIQNVADGGTVQINGTCAVSTWPTYSKRVTITGGTLDLTGMGTTVKFNGNVTFAAMTLTMTANATVYANGHTVTVSEDVTVTNAVTAIYGGGASGTTVTSTSLTLLAGDYKTVYGGSNKGTVSGDTHLTVGGKVNAACDWTSHTGTYKVFGGGNADTINGDVHFTFTGSAKANYIYGGSNGSAAKIAGDKYSTMSGGSTMSFYGGNVGVDTGKTNYTVMNGGQLQQLFGGNSGANMTGDVYLSVLGGTVTRRIYGGCYNEYDETESGKADYQWHSNYNVQGVITLIFGNQATINFSKDGLSDHSIFAHSRCESASANEKGVILYLNSTAYQNVNGKIGHKNVYSFFDALGGYAKPYAADTLLTTALKNLSKTEETHTVSYTASGAIITEACSLCSTAHSATATLARKDTAPLIYSGSALTPEMTVNFSDGWKGLSLFTIDYTNNVNAGTATASATCNGVTASLNFTIEKADQAAPNITGAAETVKGKADGKISGLSTEMEYSTDGVSYIPVTDVNMALSAGTYSVRLPEKDNHKASPATTVTVAAGRQLAVTFVADGVTVATKYVDWNGTVTDIPDIPAKAHHDRTAPTWNGSYSNLQADATVTAVYTPNVYTVTFKIDGETVDTQNVAYGSTVQTPPAIPDKVGFDSAWETAVSDPVSGDIIINAVYAPKQFTVTFVASGATVATKTVTYGQALTDIPEVPTKAGYDKTAPVWSITDFASITENLTVEAIYTPNRYTITFKVEGEPLTTREVLHGNALADIPAVPTKEGFTGAWEVANFDTVTGDMTVNAVYTVKEYTVTFKADGNTVATLTVKHGEAVTSLPDIPTKNGYTQTAPTWEAVDLSGVTEDMTVNAVYTPNVYTVTFKADGKTVATLTVEHGKGLNAPDIPAKTGYTQTAPRWSAAVSSVTRDMTVSAIYTADRYTIIFVANGVTVATKTVSFGATLQGVPAVPEKVGHTGAWDRTSFKDFTENTTVTALYTPNTYTVTFKAENETVATRDVVYGTPLTDLPTVPEKVGHTGAWEVANFDTVEEDMTVLAVYTKRSFTVTFVADGVTVGTCEVLYGETVESTPAIPEKVGYTKVPPVWDVALTSVTEDLTATAVYTLNTYTVTFVADGVTVSTLTVDHGAGVTAPAVPAKDGFNGMWNTSNFDTVTGDMTVTAVYIAQSVTPDPDTGNDTEAGDSNDAENNRQEQADGSESPSTDANNTDSDESGSALVIVLIVVGVCAAAGAVVAVVIIKKKNA